MRPTTAREYVLSLLTNCREASLKQICERVPKHPDAIEWAIKRLTAAGTIQRVSVGVYRLTPPQEAKPEKPAPKPAAPQPQFIKPIPLNRLMAGR